LLVSVESQQIEQVMEYIERISEIHTYRQYNNIYNVRAVATLKNLNELDQVKDLIRTRLPANGLRTYIWTDVRNIPENLNLFAGQETVENNNLLQIGRLKQNQKEKRIDDVDLQIVEKLAEDGRIPFQRIAKNLQTSTDTIIKRYNKLRNRQVVKVSIQIDPNKIGYQSILDFNIALASPSNSSNSIEALARIPDIITVTKTSGEFDLQLTAMVRNIEQMYEIQNEISNTPGVAKMDVSLRKIPNKWPAAKQHISTF
jgi:DNA-binding Lrp family transcriptional regulator